MTSAPSPGTAGRAGITLITGADEAHAPYLRALLESLALMNDRGLPLRAFDWGLRPETRAAIQARHPDLGFLHAPRIEADLARLRDTPGVAALPYAPYVLGTLRKLALAEFDETPFFFWIDADCLALRPLSEWLPAPLPCRLIAGRDSRRAVEAQFYDRNPLLREALAQHLLRSAGVESPSHSSFNSGALMADTAHFATLVDGVRDSVLLRYGPYLMGDQGVLNVALALRGEQAERLHPGINMAVASRDAPCTLVEDRLGDLPFASLRLEEKQPLLYHFLNVKPLKARTPDHPVCQLFQWWHDRAPTAGTP